MSSKSTISMPGQNKQKGKPDPKKMKSNPKHQKELHKRTNNKGYNEQNMLNTPGAKHAK